MMKRIGVFIIVCCLATPLLSAHADVIVGPENSFLNAHEDQVVVLNRTFVASGEQGQASVMQEPGSSKEIAQLTNGDELLLNYSCLYEGSYWGYGAEHNGWVSIDELLVVYDYVSFLEEHKDEVYPFEGDLSKLASTDSVLAWPWPGSETYFYALEDLDSNKLHISHGYRDSEEREWGFVSNYGQRYPFWVCLDDPTNRDILAFCPAQEPAAWVSDTPHTDIKTATEIETSTEESALPLVIVLVVVLAVITIALIAVLMRPGKRHTQ